jgi:hypothetical protein
MVTHTAVEANPLETDRTEAMFEHWAHWPLHWSGVIAGALAAIAIIIIVGLIGVAVGASAAGPDHRVVDLKKLAWGALILSVVGAFFSYIVGGWVAAKIAGLLRREIAMLHGAIVWLASIPVLLVLAGIGAGGFMGGWFGGLANDAAGVRSTPPFERPEAPAPNASTEARAKYLADQAAYEEKVHDWHQETPKAVQISALGAVSGLLLGLIGAVLGGWLGSGELMNFGCQAARKDAF